MGKNKHKKHHKHDSSTGADGSGGLIGGGGIPGGMVGSGGDVEVRGQDIKLIIKVGGQAASNEAPPLPPSMMAAAVGNSSLNMVNHHLHHGASSSSSPSMLDLGGVGLVNKAHKKKKKKKEKKKEKEKKHKHHHKEKRKRSSLDEQPTPTPLLGDDPISATPPPIQPPAKILRFDESSAAGIVGVNPKLVAIDPTEESPSKNTSADDEDMKSDDNENDEKSTTSSNVDKPKTPLTELLNHILPLLQKRDQNNFFAFPVSDNIAPGYSTVISNPMDFSTMKSKLDNDEYKTLKSFQSDFELMCNNAMVYNTQDTIYYKAAKKLLSLGLRFLTPERLKPLKEHFSFMKDLTVNELGFDIHTGALLDASDYDDVQNVIDDIREQVKRPLGRFEAIPDDLTPAEVLEQATKAAAEAKAKLHKSKNRKSRMGFLRRNPDGSTSLSFLTGNDGVIPGTERDRPVSLGNLIGKVKQGTGSIQCYKEDRHNLAKSVHPLYYGAFSSHGPSYDSTFSNLTKEETELVYSTYADDSGVNYAESILNFGRDCSSAMVIVDHLLDVLTGNEHRKTSKYIEQQKVLRQEDELMHKIIPSDVETIQEEKDKNEGKNKTIDFDSLKSLKDDGIDMSFLDNLQAQYDQQISAASNQETVKVEPKQENEDEEQETMEKLLEKNANLIMELKDVQNDRLSANLPQHFGQISKPSEKEELIASKVRQNLANISKTLTPESVVPIEGIKKLLGIHDKA